MGSALYGSLALTVVAFADLVRLRVPEPTPDPSGRDGPQIDIRGAIEAIAPCPAVNANRIGGVRRPARRHVHVIDRRLRPVSRVRSDLRLLFGFIGSRSSPVASSWPRSVFAAVRYASSSSATSSTGRPASCSPVSNSVIPLIIGMIVWLALIPAIEAAEQTVLQQVDPVRAPGPRVRLRPAREDAAAPVTALAMSPLARSMFMPAATDGSIADTIGSWWGTGAAPGLAVMFTLAGLIGVVVTVISLGSRSYRRLSGTVHEVASPRRRRSHPRAPCLVRRREPSSSGRHHDLGKFGSRRA